jgi:hypothetical protein
VAEAIASPISNMLANLGVMTVTMQSPPS